MPPATDTRATLDDLYGVEGKAELIGGRIVHFMASGDQPSLVAFEIAMSLYAHALASGRGQARADGPSFAVKELASGRESFAPDASYYLGPRPSNRLRFVEGAPTFAVEVRGENDYGPAAEREMAAKRLDYFEAGTAVVWDVDTVAERIHKYHRDDPTEATTFGRGRAGGWRSTRCLLDRIAGSTRKRCGPGRDRPYSVGIVSQPVLADRPWEGS